MLTDSGDHAAAAERPASVKARLLDRTLGSITIGCRAALARELVRAAPRSPPRVTCTRCSLIRALTDRTENALKIAGDGYAARLLALTGSWLGLDQWKAAVRDKLKTLHDIYRFAIEDASFHIRLENRGHAFFTSPAGSIASTINENDTRLLHIDDTRTLR